MEMEEPFSKNKANITVILLFGFGVMLIFFLSWKTDPNLEELPFIPDWLSNWTDHVRNDTRRTAVPFIGLGLLIGAYIVYSKRTGLVFWFFSWFVLVVIVCVAEAGQYFLPSRIPDIKDVIWGVVGAFVGLFFPFLTSKLINTVKK